MRKPIALLALLLSAGTLFAAHPFQLGAFISYQEGRIPGALDSADGNRTTLCGLGDLRLFYRTALSANIGGLGLSIAAEFPVKGTFSAFDALPDFPHTRVRLSGLLNFY